MVSGIRRQMQGKMVFVSMWQVKSAEELPDGVTPQRKAEVAGGREGREPVT